MLERDVAKEIDGYHEKIAFIPEHACWEWLAAKNRGGYGVVQFGDRIQLAHRVAYELEHGHPVPGGLQIDHLCRNRACVNPQHLEAVTQRVNIARGISISVQYAARDRCINGHPFTPDNLGRGHKGSRRCKTCHREQERARRQC